MPTESQYTPVDVPETDIWRCLFERKDRPYPDDKVICIDNDTGRSYTYAQTRNTAIKFGKGLKAAWGWQKGDVMALYTPNCIDTPAVTWGVQWAGGVVSPANPNYTVEELAFQLKDCGAKGLITQKGQLEAALEAARRVGVPKDRVILIGDEAAPGVAKHFTTVTQLSQVEFYGRTKCAPDDLAFLVYSSGTTGLPKGVMLSHRNIVSNVVQLYPREQLSWTGGKDNTGDRVLAFLPFFHIYGLNCCLHQAYYAGWTLVVMRQFTIEGWCEAVQRHAITFSYVVPPVVLLLCKHPCVSDFDLSSLRMLNSGAAPLTAELVEACYERIRTPIKQGYGLSETSPTSHVQPWDRWRSSVGSVGTLISNMSAKFVNEDGKELAEGQTGELWMKGPNIFMGYLNNAEGTRGALTDDGYFKTGDVGYVDKEGNFYITDRVKELIKYKGFQVPPAELEGLLLSHPRVADCAVIGVPGEATELPRAYVVATGGQSQEASDALGREIAAWLASRVAPHKRLRGGVRFVAEIPKSASGKILRRMLRDQAKGERREGGAKL